MIHVAEFVESLKRVSFIAGQRSDYIKALDLIDNQKMSTLIADKGYDAHDMVNAAKAVHAEVFIPTRSQRRTPREYDQE